MRWLNKTCVLAAKEISTNGAYKGGKRTILPELGKVKNEKFEFSCPKTSMPVFDFGFKLNPAIGISAQSMGNGDYYTITSKSTTGFTIEFFNSSATSIDRSFDYIVKGVGQVIF